ncbi:MAG: DUF2279 domain-containing protein [Candidatus Rokuibacteriota bacterium]
MSADELSLAFDDRAFSPRPCPEHRLFPTHDEAGGCRARAIELAAVDEVGAAETPSEEGASRPEEKKPRRVLGALVAAADFAATAANSTLGYTHRSFHFNREGFFGAGTEDGGADKASHFVDYYIVAKELTNIYRLLDYSEREAIWMGFGVAAVGGLVNEVGDGFQRHGFSYEDLVMDTLGAGTATLISATRTHDLVGFRTSHLPGPTYIHDVYSADLKISGLAQRLGMNVGPLRFLLFSVTYGVKGYRNNSLRDDQQRQLGFEIGVNLEEILNAIGATRNTWWGYPLHMVGDNVRFPYLAIGFRYDLNHGQWHGPNNGNYP